MEIVLLELCCILLLPNILHLYDQKLIILLNAHKMDNKVFQVLLLVSAHQY